MRLRRTALLLPIVALSTFALTGAAAKPPPTQAADAKLDAALMKLVGAKGGPPGIAVVVQRGTDTKLHTAGVANIETGKAAKITDHTRIASVAKAFSGAAALALVSQGVLSLDDTIGMWLPDLPEGWADVTLAQLLQHTSGISDFSDNPHFVDELISHLQDPLPPAELLAFAEPEPTFTPGTKYHYSNSDNIIVGLIVAAAAGKPYEKVLKTEVYKPLGLTRTSLPTGSKMPSPFIHGYGISRKAPPEDVSEQFAAGWTWASGGIVSTPGDANTFVRGYASGALFDEETHDAQFTFRRGNSEPTGPGTNYAGLGIFEYKTRCGTVYGHTGNTSGYTEFIASSADGTRSTSVSVNAQITPKTNRQFFGRLRNIFQLAVCAATA